jgi:hypothetical protein
MMIPMTTSIKRTSTSMGKLCQKIEIVAHQGVVQEQLRMRKMMMRREVIIYFTVTFLNQITTTKYYKATISRFLALLPFPSISPRCQITIERDFPSLRRQVRQLMEEVAHQ